MNTYTITGTFTFMVQAEDKDSALELMNDELGSVLLEWNAESVH